MNVEKRWACVGLVVGLCLLVSAGSGAGEQSSGRNGPPAAKNDKSSDKGGTVTQKPGQQTTQQPKEQAKQKPSQPSAPKTFTVRREPLRKIVKLTGVFEAERMHPISVNLQEWSTLEVVWAVPHGKTVRKGERLVQFDTSKIDKAIAQAQLDLQLAEINQKLALEKLKALEQTVPLDQQAAARSHRYAQEDWNRFLRVDRPMAVKSAEMSLKWAKNSLEYELEELRQLEKMYKADDLTEETEEIILKRQRDAVERARFYVEQAQVRHDETLHVTLPRQEVSMKENLKRQDIAFRQSQVTLPLQLSKAKLELQKQSVELQKLKERLAKLQADRKAMEVRSPANGVVYYGEPTRGKWPSVSSLESKLRPGGQVSPKEVFLTVVEPKSLFVRATVKESDLGDLRPGLKAVAVPAGFPETRLTATLRSVSLVPIAPGTFEALARVTIPRKLRVTPGMACTLRVLAYENPRALTLPASVVFTEEGLEAKHYVWLQVRKGHVEKRYVTGRKVGDKFEILHGLREGDRVLSAKPEEQS